MVSVFYFLSFVASCFILTQICSSMIVDDRYSSSSEIGLNDGQQQQHGENDDQIYVVRRSAHFLFPARSFILPANRINDYQDFAPIKRQSFGRKHHWDAFFGRR